MCTMQENEGDDDIVFDLSNWENWVALDKWGEIVGGIDAQKMEGH